MQRLTANWLDVEPVSLKPGIKSAVTLIDSNTNPGLLEPLSKAQTTDAATDDEDM
jgi:hypothetical protein